MVQIGNNWLQRVSTERLTSGTMVLDALFDLSASEANDIFEEIRDYKGSKIVVSCTEESNLEDVLKLSLCLANLTIIVPAPLWVRCSEQQTRYCEFNYESIGVNGWNSAAGVQQKISDLAVYDPGLFKDGLVTFLPILGRSPHRWSDPELNLPELPASYSTYPTHDTTISTTEALYGLISERLVAEKMGAIHLNSASFLSPVLNDFLFRSKTEEDGLMEISVPDFGLLSISDVVRLRREFADDFSRFATSIRDALQVRPSPSKDSKQAHEALCVSSTSLKFRLTSETIVEKELDQIRISAVGRNAGVRRGIDCLAEAGALHDSINRIMWKHQLKLRESSFFVSA
jgi:hypothetical protein